MQAAAASAQKAVAFGVNNSAEEHLPGLSMTFRRAQRQTIISNKHNANRALIMYIASIVFCTISIFHFESEAKQDRHGIEFEGPIIDGSIHDSVHGIAWFSSICTTVTRIHIE